MVENTLALYGSVKGIAGASVQDIKALELDDTALLDEPDDDES